jgi:hypothetical protein
MYELENLHIETASVDQTISRVRFTKDAGTRTWFARMMEKAIMTKESVKTQTRPSFCFAETLTLYINLSGMAMTVIQGQQLYENWALELMKHLLHRSVTTSAVVEK